MKKNRRYLWWGVAAIGAVLAGAWYFLPALLSGRGFTAPAAGGSSARPSTAPTLPAPTPPAPQAAPDAPPPEPADPYAFGSYWSGYWDDPERGPVDAALAWWTDTTYYSSDD